jgi:hypothetical protein
LAQIQVYSNESDSPSPRGESDISERIKTHENVFEKSSPEPADQIQLNLVQIILG